MILSNSWHEIMQEMNIQFWSDEAWILIYRLLLNFLFIGIIIRYIYYPRTQRKDYLFTYFMIGTIVFFLCFALKKLDIDIGMGLGLFAIFGILRYRTNTIAIKEMTYLFIIIGLSVINALAQQISIFEISLVNIVILLMAGGLEYIFLLKHESRKTIIYEKIQLIHPDKYDEMLSDLRTRTGIPIHRFEIGEIDFLNDTAQVMIFYFDDETSVSDYNQTEKTKNI
ncbi:MAG: DUF4956 domain-containing protein [Crocinitomicaceae bacterium]|nr:DUF4956 domain-containing protein [Crocinitomicaceae bacterium]